MNRNLYKTFGTLSLAFGVSLIINALPCEAESATDTGDTRTILDFSLDELSEMKIETASKRPQKLSETPADTVVVRRQQIIERHYRHLGDLLEDLPSVDVYRNNAEEVKTLVSIRGIAGTNKFLILKNGQRLNPPTGESLPVDYNYPLYDAERVEVIYGPASALYGADAFSGIINIITVDISKTNGKEFALAYGSDRDRYAHAYAGQKFGEGLAVEIGTQMQRSDNPDLDEAYPDSVVLGPLVDFGGNPIPDLTRTDQYSNRTESLSLDARLKFEEQFTLGLNHRTFSQKSGSGQLPNTTIYGPEFKTNVGVLYAEYKTKLSDSLSARSNLSYMNSEIDPESGYNNIFVNYNRSWKYGSNQIMNAVQEFIVDLNDSNHLVVGFTGSNTHALPQTTDLAYEADPDRALEEQGYLYPGTNLPVQFYDTNSHLLGAFSQLQTEWTDDLSTTLGVRYDDDSRYGDSANPRVGVVYRVSEAGTAKILYGESFRAPPTIAEYASFGSFTGIDAATGKPSAEFFHVPNPNLKPEKARTIEGNYMYLLDPNSLISGSLFSTWVDDLLDNNATQGRTEFAGGIVDGTIESDTNKGKAWLYGGNIGFNLNHKVGNVGVSPFLNYSYTHGELDEGDFTHKTPYLMPHKVKGGVTLRLEQYTATLRYRYNGNSYLVRDDFAGEATTYKIPSSHLCDLVFRAAEIAKGVSITFDIRNLFDKRYTMPGGIYSNNYIESPQDPRIYLLQANYEF